MNPRMKDKGTPGQPENNFQIGNPWILPQTPGNQIPSGSNGISIDGGNQSEKREWSEFFKLLDQQSKGTVNSSTAGNNYNLNKPLNQSSSSYGMGSHQMESGIVHVNNFSITGPTNQISIPNGIVDLKGDGIIRGGDNANFGGTLYQINSSNNMGDYQMRSQSLHTNNNSYLTGSRNQISSNSVGDHIGNGIIQGGGNSNFIGILNQNSSSNSIGNHRMENEILQGGNNFKLTMKMNQISSPNGAENYQGNGIIQSGNHCNVNGTINQISSFKGMDDHHQHQFGNGIVRGGNYIDLTGPTNEISSSNGTGNNIGKWISRGSSSSRIIGTQNAISSSNSMGNHPMGNQILLGGNNFNVGKNQISSSNSRIQNGTMQGGNNSNFTGLRNQISSLNSIIDHRIGDENLGHCPNSQTQTFHNDNSSLSNNLVASHRGLIRNPIPQPTFPTMKMSPTTILRTDSVIPSPVPNLNMQALRPPRDNNSSSAPLVLNSYSEVDSSWTEGNFTSLLLGDEIPDLNPNNSLNAHNSLQLLNNGFHIHTLPNNNLNSPARHDNDARTRNANSFLLAPITPDHANLLEKKRQAEMLKFLVDDGSCQEHDKDNLLSPIANEEAIQNHCSQLLQTIVNSSSTVVSTPQAENKITEERGDQDVIDLNETPKQKTPKRRKHRPKVVKEGKPKTTPKPKTPKNRESGENPPRKRKYVRKNKAPEGENATPLQTDAVDTVEVHTFKPLEESCRKRLNFDFELSERQESRYNSATVHVAHHQGNQPVLDLNLNYPANQMPVESLAGKDSHASPAPLGMINYNTSNEIGRNLIMENNENQVDQDLQEQLNKSFSPANFNTERSKVMRWKSTHQMVERDVGNFKGFCESKAEETLRTEKVGPSSKHKLGSPTMCLEPIRSKNQETVSPKVGTLNPETCKKQKINNDFHTMLCGSAKEQSTNDTYGENIVGAEKYVPWNLTASKRKMLLAKMRERKAHISTQVQSTGYLLDVPNSNLQSVITPKNAGASGYQQESEKCQATTQNNKLKITPNPCRVITFCSNEVPSQERKDTSHSNRQKPVKARGPPKTIKYSKKMVDEITNRLQGLKISGDSGETSGTDKFALIPYEGGGAMVAYEPKKRKRRPKVDLDPETTRIWNLLMGKEGSEASDAENKNKEKWWKEERTVFHGRAESFIARMHLVQGDRRFSPWKGSVVDSIIGVFLTQNVSDQLSSSAFMALAAQFPLCSFTPDQTSDQSGTSILTEEPGIQNNTTGCSEKITRQPFYRQSSETYLGSSGAGKTGLVTESNRITAKNASSPQNSSDSSVHHMNGENQSSSGSSSEAEDANNGGQSIKNNGLTSVQHENSTGPLQVENNLNSIPPLNHPFHSSISSMQNSTKPLSYYQMLMEAQVPRSELNCFEISREECRSSFPSRAPEMMTKRKSIGNWDDRVGHVTTDMMAKPLYQQNGLQNRQAPNTDIFGFLTHRAVQEVSAQQVPQIGNEPLALSTYQGEKSRIYESKDTGFNNLSKPDEPFIARNICSANQIIDLSKDIEQSIDVQEGTTEANKQVFLGDITTDGNARGQIHFPGEARTEIHVKTLKGSQNHKKEKKPSFDWDSLRKIAQSNVTGKENSMDASDSMDYEAMRCADVNVISDSIRMRGMNHMLAERIKAFLNRVVTDHGSINLEWLRDVPPDKAKDYLLSIRGLGLKSVECVRLLTLHHLAFPVDTNVGRIVVRLGWVPIQPLPESLQLHLLEMYPVLESVQKYLWPRLCKLDQKTLYELHYQLITFGKVFCTKSKPNCNACPLRGECRHFASAFASARLALPAPEEKGIVSSTVPTGTEGRANLPTKTLLLQPSNSTRVRELTVKRCEPIIEEPASPEPDIAEITEADIEDAFYEEDPDEIPTIRLNVEQLTVNLRNFMEEHMDLQEDDMSKALVALTPEAASIPMPKLKYILRLRTERQVYVLTDTHPLIKGLDKREFDDPSPYLLALLAPGEEASLGQPSGRGCESKGSGDMTNEKDCCSVNEEANSLTVRGTLLIPCRTAMRGSFPLNGTYFQVNEVFADHESSLNPIDVPREWLWNLETRTVFFGTSATSIFRGMTTKEIQNSFWRGFVCVRGFDRKTRAPRPLNRNLHVPQGKTVKTSNATL